jgi:phenylpropionate dioxygenase-like ring-hydroxylating dioxygenase large terminal subunit
MNSKSKHHTALPLPDGWFAVAWSKDLQPGDVVPLRYFDEHLVLFRTRDGVPKVLDAFCAHLGAHLGEGGRVVGDSIRCPFHGWRYDGDSGTCVEIPYCQKIPPRARVRAWPVVEANRMIFVWRHGRGEAPLWDVPVMPEIGAPEWSEPRYFELEVPVHMQEMSENNCDPVHFHYVHGAPGLPMHSKIEFGPDGRFFRMTDEGERQTAMGRFHTVLERDTWQLGISSVRTRGIPGAGLLLFTSTTPIDADHSHSRWLLTVTRNLADVAGEEWMQALTQGVQQDMRIWKNKIHRARPVLCEGDTYLAHFRQWVKQFYSEAAAEGKEA